MKTSRLAGLCLALMASLVPALAADNADQAAARSALVKKLFELDGPHNPSPPPWYSGAVVAGPKRSTNQIIESVITKTEPPQTAPPATNLIIAPAQTAPAAVPSAVAMKPVEMPAPRTRPDWSTTPAIAVKPVSTPNPAKTPPPPPATPKPNPAPLVIKASNSPVKTQPANDLVTTTGATYRAARVEKVESDGLIISYVPAGGGLAITKVLFEDLPEELRKPYEKKKP